jgi:isopentenyl diphosphate isomerase/L-lactate dehydrogenase-like FMN-dependent dehydrogenase
VKTGHSIADIRRQSRAALPRVVFDYVDGGAEDEVTLAENRRSFGDLALRPRNAVKVGKPDLSTSVVGHRVSLPILLAPCGLATLVDPAGEPAAARAAEAAGTVSVVSTVSGRPLEEVAAASKNAWFQLYFLGGREGAEVLMDRAAAAGMGTLVLTIDTGAVGNRERDIRNGMRGPLRVDLDHAIRHGPGLVLHPRWLIRFMRAGMPIELGNLRHLGPDGAPMDPTTASSAMASSPPTWADLHWIRARWRGSLVVKGVLTGDDARQAADLGADAVVVSNHGGRQLDGAVATMRVLPEVVAAMGSRTEVFLDGGVRRGSDVAKAIALGARAVLVGRPWLYGLAVDGQQGVSDVIEVLRSELSRTMRLVGATSLAELDETWVMRTRE